MKQIADAPWIRDAKTKGYPVGEDTDDIEIKIFPTMPEWLWGEE